MNVLRLLFFFIFLPFVSFSQFTPSFLSNADRFIISEIARDTNSELIKYAGHHISFGIGNKRDFNPIIIKSKKKIYFLLEGTNRVYQLIKENNNVNDWKITRIDSTSFYGDNFNMMAFYRKDTIFQYGGYGFWQNRDFFSYYRPLSHDWEFYQGGDALQSIYSLNYYDKNEDKFYLIGRFHQDSHKNPRPNYIDSVYMYDFKIQKWHTLGKLQMQILDKSNLDNRFQWTNEKGQYFFNFNNIYFIDASKNSVYPLKKEFFDDLQTYLAKNDLTSDIINFTASWGDSLLIVTGEPNHFVSNKMKITNDYFDFTNPKPLYEPNKPIENLINIKLSTYELSAYILFNISLILSILYFFKKKNKQLKKINSESQNSAIPFFAHLIYQLNQSEIELLKEMMQSSLKGKKLDINSVNKILGVQNKQSMVQKTRRSLSITRINDLYMNLSGSSTALIKRAKDDQDKRIYNYFIPVKEAIELDQFFREN